MPSENAWSKHRWVRECPECPLLLTRCLKLLSYLCEVVEDVQAALGDGDVHGVFGADADNCLRFWQDDKVVSVNGTPVLDWVGLHLKEKRCR